MFLTRTYAAVRVDLMGRARNSHASTSGACTARAARSLHAWRVQGARSVVPDQDEVGHLVDADSDESVGRLVGVVHVAAPRVRREAQNASPASRVGQPHGVRHPEGWPTVHQRVRRRPQEGGVFPPKLHMLQAKPRRPRGPNQKHHDGISIYGSSHAAVSFINIIVVITAVAI